MGRGFLATFFAQLVYFGKLGTSFASMAAASRSMKRCESAASLLHITHSNTSLLLAAMVAVVEELQVVVGDLGKHGAVVVVQVVELLPSQLLRVLH